MRTRAAKPVDLSSTPARDLLPLEEAIATWFPKKFNKKPYSRASAYRWASTGLRGVKLKVIHIGASAVTSEAAVHEFMMLLDRTYRQPESDTGATQEQLEVAGL